MLATVMKKLPQLAGAAVLLAGIGPARVDAGVAWELSEQYPHTRLVASSESDVNDHEVGLSPLQRAGSSGWGFARSERLSGYLRRVTWQITEGYSAEDAFKWWGEQLSEQAGVGTELLYQCRGRGCGRSVQWGNAVFGQRILYGRDDEQRYSVHRVQTADREYRVVLYAVVRPPDRHYLHADILRLAP